jgi:hypothetical protein
MILVMVESPFKPTDDEVARYAGRYSRAELLRQNLVYARLALCDALRRNEAPAASHLLYTQVWSESDEERVAGIKAGVEWAHRADLCALYVDLGISSGMKLTADNARLIGLDQTRRMILDAGAGRDPRDELAVRDLPSFPYLEELRADEWLAQQGVGALKAGA